MQGLFASLEDYDLQNTTVPEVDDGDVVEMFEAAQEVGREVEADTAQAQDAMAVVEALENYRELLKRELALGDGVNRTTTRAIEIGVEALTARYRNEDGAPLAWSMESFDTPGQAVRATQASLEGIGDIMSDITAKAKAFAQRAMAGLAKMTRATANFFSSVKGRAQKLRKQVESAEFESKTLKADDYAYICTGGKIDFGASLGNVQKFIDNFVLGDGIVKPSREIDKAIEEVFSGVNENTTCKEFADVLKGLEAKVVSKVKNGFKDGTMVISDRVSLELSSNIGVFDINVVDSKKPIGGETQSIDKNEAIKSLDKVIAQCQAMESVKWEDVYERIGAKVTSSSESINVGSIAWEAFKDTLVTCFKWAFILGLSGLLIGTLMLVLASGGGTPAFVYLPIAFASSGFAAPLHPFSMLIVFLVKFKRLGNKAKLDQLKEEVKQELEAKNQTSATEYGSASPASISMEANEDLDPKERAEAEKLMAQANAKIAKFIVTAAEYTDLMLKSVYMDGMDYIQDSM